MPNETGTEGGAKGFNKVLQRLMEVAVGLATLKVTTCVGEIHAKQPPQGPGVADLQPVFDAAKTRMLKTEVNLVAGDGNNYVHDDFLTGESAGTMREFHERQLARSQDIVQRNVDLMIKLGKEIKELLR